MNKTAILLAISVALLFSTSCGQIMSSVRDGVHQAESQPRPTRIPAAEVEDVTVGSEPLNWTSDEYDSFSKTLRSVMKKRDFAALDAMAADFRQKKELFSKGGGWKIHSFYVVTSEPADKTDAAWVRHINLLKDWKMASPKSIAARSALADAYLGYAWKARGTGYASEIPANAMPDFESRLEQAVSEIHDASTLEERCYGYFETLLRIGSAVGMDKNIFNRVFEDAIAYDKTYQYFYVVKAECLLPRWGGEPGEMEAFVNKLPATLGETEGLKVYYLIVAKLQSYKWEGEFFVPGGLSWRRTKKGFLLYEKDYGASRFRVNEFAKLALTANDTQAGCNTFKRLQGKNDFEPEIWITRENFGAARNMALALCQIPRFENQAK